MGRNRALFCKERDRFMTQPFVDTSAVVTGAGSGIGAAIAILLAERGAAVTLVGRRDASLEEVAGEIRPVADFRRTVAIDFASIFYGMKYEIAAMLQTGRGGAIVDVSSVFADRGLHVDYSGSKHGIRGLTRSAAKDYGEEGIRVVELQPGVIDTEMTAADPDGTAAVAATGIPLRRAGTSHEIATVVAFLLSAEASYVTGAYIAVDGGFLA
jgi:NAD(P)-dependent dehydrogenase (short-subunit alcohol dehydrogenase family)